GAVLARTSSRSMLAVPLIVADRLIGVLVYGLADPHSFSAQDLATIQAVAMISAVGLAHALSHESERYLRRQVEAASRAALAFSHVSELRRVLQVIVEAARTVSDAEYAALGVVVSADRPFDPWVFSGISEEEALRIGRHPRPIGTLGQVVITG